LKKYRLAQFFNENIEAHIQVINEDLVCDCLESLSLLPDGIDGQRLGRLLCLSDGEVHYCILRHRKIGRW